MKLQYRCNACGSKVTDWEKHIKTKRHFNSFKKFQKRVLYIEKELFDSRMVTKVTIPSSIFPRIKERKL